ncbi:TTC1 [Symbiodinium sp. KB8]|nr:TTC1 [Symbiodinium sp. KB8]
MADSVPGEHVDRPAREQAAPALPGVGDETSSTDEVDSAAVLTASAAGAERAPERAVAPVDEVTAGAADAGTPSGAGAATDKVAAHPDGAPASSGPGGSVAGGAVLEPVAAQEGHPDAGAEADAASDGGEAAGSAACAADEAAPDVTEEEDDAAGRSESEADSLKAEGNKLFSKGAAEEALALYEEAIAVAPLRPALAKKRAAYHANRAACLLQLERFEEAIAACDDCLDLDPSYLKAMLRRVTALEKLGMLEEAQQDYEDILEEFPGNATAKAGLARIKAEQTAKEEKLKEEMMGKLKDMGNSLLGHFGLSVDNFKFDKDPKTGGYNINFQQGAPPPAGGDGEPKPPASG